MKILALILMSLFTTQTLHADRMDVGNPDIPRPWRIPSAFNSFTITHGAILRQETGEVTYKIRINAHLPGLGMITQAKLVRHPNRVLIDKARNIGVYEEKLDANGADIYLETGGVGRKRQFPKGVYVLTMRLADGKKVEGWFILNRPLSPVAPRLLSPVAGQTYTTPNPVFSWRNFFSPQYRGNEERKVYTRVYSGPEAVWAAYEDDADVNQVTVGQAPSQEGVTALQPGNYDAHIVYREGSQSGPIWFGREYRTVAPFSIQ